MSPCVIPTFGNHTFTITGTGTALDTSTFFIVPISLQQPNLGTCATSGNLSFIAQIPAGSGTGGTATIVLNSSYTRGINYINVTSESGPRYSFGGETVQAIMGAAGLRVYFLGQYLDNPTTRHWTAIFNDEVPDDSIRDAPPLRLWPHADDLACEHDSSQVLQRLTPCLFQQRGPGPDYGQYFEATVRLSSGCNMLMVQSLIDNTVTRTLDLSSIVVSGQSTIKYCAGWLGISVSTIASGVMSDADVFDPILARSPRILAFRMLRRGILRQPSPRRFQPEPQARRFSGRTRPFNSGPLRLQIRPVFKQQVLDLEAPLCP